MSKSLTIEEAERLAVATLAAIDTMYAVWLDPASEALAADWKRIESDLAGLREHQRCGTATDGIWNSACIHGGPCPDARRYFDGLRRTATLYGITP